MSYGKLNIWLRELDCGPKNVWKAELVVKTCGGDYLVDFNPDVVDKLKEAFPNYNIVGKGSRNGETTIIIKGKYIKHIEVDVPPGCYIVRAWVCSGNLWTDRVMAIVGCGGEACVNLIVPQKENCIRDVIIPVGIAAHDFKLDPDKLRVATEVLMMTAGVRKESLLKELTDTIKELEKSDDKDAAKYAQAFKSTADLVKRTRIERE